MTKKRPYIKTGGIFGDIFLKEFTNMRIQKFTVSNYRSILGAKNITMGEYTVLVGKNNEGKSNLIRALNLAMGNMKDIALQSLSPTKDGWNTARMRFSSNAYSYDLDFPKNHDSKKKGVTKIQLHFELSSTDISDFHEYLNLRTNNSLTLIFSYDDNNILNIQVAKRGGKNWQSKILNIIKFVSRNINFTYVPAVRTADTFQNIINSELRLAINKTIHDEEYKDLIDKLFKLEQNAVNDIADSITPKLAEWLPKVSDVRIAINNISPYRRPYFSYRNSNLYITSSGTETLLENKGDGVQSLFALALLAKNNEESQDSILAIDEPEAHLHPEAIHRLQKTITDLSSKSQVIVATHNPIFVNKNDESSNVIVNNGSVRKAKTIKEIRDILGVEVEDNLINSKSVLMVEGVSDQKFIYTFIKLFGSQALKNKFNSGQIPIIPAHGVNKIKAKVQIFQNIMVNYFIVVDHDQPASQVIKSLLDKQELAPNQFSYIPKKIFQTEAELEDLYSNEFISLTCHDFLNIDIKAKLDNCNRKIKWSRKMSNILPEVGKEFDQDTEDAIKTKLAESLCVSPNPEKCLSDNGKEFVHTLINQISTFFI